MADRTLQDLAFPRLTDEQIAIVAKTARLKRFEDGHVLFKCGETAMKFYVVKSGEVEILDHTSGQPRTVTIHRPGEFTGDISHLTGNPAIVSGVCRGDCEVYEICQEALHDLLQESPRLSDVLLQAFIARRQLLEESPDFVGLRVIGSRYSRDTWRIRDFLTRNHVPFTFLDIESDPRVNDLLGTFRVGPEETPVVACAQMLVLRNPSTRDLAEELGIRRPLEKKVYDLIIVGAGPAGLAAAVYGGSEGLSTLVLEREAAGGQAGASMRIENYLGFPTGITGAELTSRAVFQAEKFGVRIATPAPVISLNFESVYPVVRMDGETITGKCLLIATGADYRRLASEGREQFEGAGVYYAATKIEADVCRGTPDVVVVGGGNSAGQAAVFLADQGYHVLLLLRGDDLYKNMSTYLARRIEHTPGVEILKNTQIISMEGEGLKSLRQVVVRNDVTGEVRTIDTRAVFTFIGAVPRTDWLSQCVHTDPKGFIRTGFDLAGSQEWGLHRPPLLLETSRPGVFAAGDARLGSVKRVASAVGEGAMAVQFIHEFLKGA
jgi:thioredoxin reductase (NADPH)